MPNYTKLATQQYDPTYNQRVQQMKSNLAQQLAGLKQQETQQLKQYDVNNATAKNNFSNQSLDRGLGRSTITTTELGGMDLANNKQKSEYSAAIDKQENQYKTQTNDSLNAMAMDRQNAINVLARQLHESDREWAYKNAQLALQREQKASAAQKKNTVDPGSYEDGLMKDLNQFVSDKTKSSQEKAMALQNVIDYYSNPDMYDGNFAAQSIVNFARAQMQKLIETPGSNRYLFGNRTSYDTRNVNY
jgi:hypothetical protein